MTLGNFDMRADPHYPVAREVIAITVADESIAKTETANINGRTTQIHFSVPVLDAADTAGLSVQDADGNVISSCSGKAENTVHVLDVHESLAGLISFVVTCSAEQNDAARAFTVTVYYT